ncbi:hypothetical protein [Saccharomonospora xinjiangensis]|uniref:Uncharacterized protein n=1 Tax=Saccharomonospora xinjiangensis XJ-54 TaxID=882086 RepID=I0V4L8_9PSEU|nr:hypothetical protein [Saccharomonospora xinjiangensis]EID55071.1 hypothetical protein SacxiDRAFT_2856 [Saccharomonospora xinjiangensis XJ-54]
MFDDDDVRALLAEVRAAPEPPLWLDGSEIAARGQRIRRRRRVLTVAGSSLAVVLVGGLVALLAASAPREPAQPATPQPPRMSAPASDVAGGSFEVSEAPSEADVPQGPETFEVRHPPKDQKETN